MKRGSKIVGLDIMILKAIKAFPSRSGATRANIRFKIMRMNDIEISSYPINIEMGRLLEREAVRVAEVTPKKGRGIDCFEVTEKGEQELSRENISAAGGRPSKVA